LPLVERPKALGLEFKRAGDMQTVQGAASHPRSMTAREFDADLKRSFRQANFRPHAAEAMFLKLLVKSISFRSRHDTPENVLLDRVRPLCAM
jgi:hypothetical protein